MHKINAQVAGDCACTFQLLNLREKMKSILLSAIYFQSTIQYAHMMHWNDVP